ncbi:MAG: N-acetylglucosaminyldiphospho-UDP N-acetyl-beta-D-mannosaminyltransferase [Desulfobulbaceae bacterium BRH_c16a]|nr:MAG: N-acetylglucosaminyldiphospho-UDP N-acetyl-beta-D-mannosaminyltransferase [Desulfobulbaceae bacterium BRH_c16a]
MCNSKETIIGIDVNISDKYQSVEMIKNWLESEGQSRMFMCANPHSLVQARKDKKFRKALLASNLTTPDGVGIVIASRILGGRVYERVTGSDIFWGLSEKLNTAGAKSYYFLGSTKLTLDKIQKKLAIDYPNIIFAGSYSPPYKEEFSEQDNDLMVEAINSASPDVLWVGMTAPKQEKWIYQNRARLNVKFIGAIGAVFDFYVGNVKRSHPVFQKMGLEWLPRLLQEPRRLFKRNFVSSPLFLYLVLKQRFGK